MAPLTPGKDTAERMAMMAGFSGFFPDDRKNPLFLRHDRLMHQIEFYYLSGSTRVLDRMKRVRQD